MTKPTTIRRVPAYQHEPYWEKETPVEARTDRVAISHYPIAGKLQICRLYVDPETKEKKYGKTVTLDQKDLTLNPEARELLVRVLEGWKE